MNVFRLVTQKQNNELKTKKTSVHHLRISLPITAPGRRPVCKQFLPKWCSICVSIISSQIGLARDKHTYPVAQAHSEHSALILLRWAFHCLNSFMHTVNMGDFRAAASLFTDKQFMLTWSKIVLIHSYIHVICYSKHNMICRTAFPTWRWVFYEGLFWF